MSIDEATAQCSCMRLNVLRQDSCNFPGLGRFYNPVIDEPKPVEPAALGERPPEPNVPPAPEAPEDQSDTVAMAVYFDDLQLYQDTVRVMQDQYRQDIRAYESEAQLYKAELTAYQEDFVGWEISRTAAVDPAVSIIGRYREEFGWTYVNKGDDKAYWAKVTTTWIAMGGIILVLTLGVLLIVKRKDVV